MKKTLLLTSGIFLVALATSCATPKQVTYLLPREAYLGTDNRVAEKTENGIAIRTALSEWNQRYNLEISIYNGKEKDIIGPDAVILKDANSFGILLLTSDQLIGEIKANVARLHQNSSYNTYNTKPSQTYYFSGQSQTFGNTTSTSGMLYEDNSTDFIEGANALNASLAEEVASRATIQAQRDIQSIELNYLKRERIPAQTAITKFLLFPKGGSAKPLFLTVTIADTKFDFVFEDDPNTNRKSNSSTRK